MNIPVHVKLWDDTLTVPHFFGLREGYTALVYWVPQPGLRAPEELPVAPSLAIRHHSPAGFEWAYHGSGPAQLALAMLLHGTGKPDVAERFYQRFKRHFVCRFPRPSWQMEQVTIIRWAVWQLAEDEEAIAGPTFQG